MKTGTTMRAITYTQYGLPDILKLCDVARPAPKANEVLVKIYACSLNASDVEFLTAKPAYVRFSGLFKPRKPILGSDIAGIVEAVGNNVSQFEVGDAVFGDIFPHFGGLAEYVCAGEKGLVKKPEQLTFEQAAAIPQAAVVALQALRKGEIDVEPIKIGRKVLINGAGGGAGSFAIQLAKMFDATVTAVDSAEKLDFMRKLGANFVIDYKQQDYAKNGQSYDLIVDFVASRKAAEVQPALAKNGHYVMVGGDVPTILSIVIRGSSISLMGDKKIGLLVHNSNQTDLNYMLERFDAGEALPIIDKVFEFEDAAAAFLHLMSGKAKGKVIVRVCPE